MHAEMYEMKRNVVITSVYEPEVMHACGYTCSYPAMMGLWNSVVQ